MSDIARVYANGKEPALGGQDLAKPEVAGKEKAQVGNANLGHDYKDDRTR